MIKLSTILQEIKVQGNKITPEMVDNFYWKINDKLHYQMNRWGRSQHQNHLDWVKSLSQNMLNEYYVYLKKLAKDRNINEIKVEGNNIILKLKKEFPNSEIKQVENGILIKSNVWIGNSYYREGIIIKRHLNNEYYLENADTHGYILGTRSLSLQELIDKLKNDFKANE